MHDFLSKQRREIDEKYDHRYSQLICVFARLIGEGYLHEDELEGLGDDKMTKILFLAGKIEGPRNEAPQGFRGLKIAVWRTFWTNLSLLLTTRSSTTNSWPFRSKVS